MHQSGRSLGSDVPLTQYWKNTGQNQVQGQRRPQGNFASYGGSYKTCPSDCWPVLIFQASAHEGIQMERGSSLRKPMPLTAT